MNNEPDWPETNAMGTIGGAARPNRPLHPPTHPAAASTASTACLHLRARLHLRANLVALAGLAPPGRWMGRSSHRLGCSTLRACSRESTLASCLWPCRLATRADHRRRHSGLSAGEQGAPATPRARACNPTCQSLQPRVPEPATPRARACHPACQSLQPHLPEPATPRARTCTPLGSRACTPDVLLC